MRIPPQKMTGKKKNNAVYTGDPERSLNDTVLLIDKREGFTSFDTVKEARKLCGVRKMGHCGTLDKFATGLLVVCAGRATRLATYLVHGEKAYQAEIKLGMVTDTGDREGLVVSTTPVKGITEERLREALSFFQGEITQVPPVYSALKIEGTRASDLVRQGREVSLKERKVTVSEIRLTAFNRETSLLSLEVRCSKGTYIRSLARDLGEALGTGAYVEKLRRTGSGVFAVDDAVTTEELGQYLSGENVPRPFIIKPSRAMSAYSACVVGPEARVKARNGALFGRDEVVSLTFKEEKKFIILDTEENLIAIADIDTDKWHINYDCVLNV